MRQGAREVGVVPAGTAFAAPYYMNIATDPEQGLSAVIERNIASLLERRRKEERKQSLQERAAGFITRFAGSMAFVYLHVVLFGAWILSSPRFDPSLVKLAMFASVEAIFLSTFVLITQNRMAAEADKRAELDLQVSLLAEHEITRLITLVSNLAEKAGVEQPGQAELADLKRDIAPEKVLDRIERH